MILCSLLELWCFPHQCQMEEITNKRLWTSAFWFTSVKNRGAGFTSPPVGWKCASDQHSRTLWTACVYRSLNILYFWSMTEQHKPSEDAILGFLKIVMKMIFCVARPLCSTLPGRLRDSSSTASLLCPTASLQLCKHHRRLSQSVVYLPDKFFLIAWLSAAL